MTARPRAAPSPDLPALQVSRAILAGTPLQDCVRFSGPQPPKQQRIWIHTHRISYHVTKARDYEPTRSDENSHSMRTRLSGRVYRSTWNSPSANALDGRRRGQQASVVALTLDVVLGVSLRRLVVVDHLHHPQQVVFAELLEIVRQFVHVDLDARCISFGHRGGCKSFETGAGGDRPLCRRASSSLPSRRRGFS